MDDTPEAAPQGTEAAPQSAPVEPAQAPEINAEQVAKYFGTDAETLGKFQKFVEANGKFDSAFSKMKADISNPQPAPTPQPEAQPINEPTSQPQYQPQPEPYKAPEGSITPQEFLAQQYFQGLSRDPKYEGISEQIANGDVLKEMASFNIQALNQDGSINDVMVRRYLDLKAQTVPAKATSTEPDASTAPTVEYVPVGDKIENIDQAYKVIMQAGHPQAKLAEDFIRSHFNPNSEKK